MNRVLVAGIASMALLVSAMFTSQECHAGRRCGGGGLLSGLGSARCGGGGHHGLLNRCGGGGLLSRLGADREACCGEAAPAPEPACCPAPEPACCPAPEPACCPAPEPTCCEVAPSCGCSVPVVSGCNSCGSGVVSMGGVISSGCANCSTTTDSGVIMESDAPSSAPPAPSAPAPTPDAAADAPSA